MSISITNTLVAIHTRIVGYDLSVHTTDMQALKRKLMLFIGLDTIRQDTPQSAQSDNEHAAKMHQSYASLSSEMMLELESAYDKLTRLNDYVLALEHTVRKLQHYAPFSIIVDVTKVDPDFREWCRYSFKGDYFLQPLDQSKSMLVISSEQDRAMFKLRWTDIS